MKTKEPTYKACNNGKVKEKQQREIKVRTVGILDATYAAELITPLILTIYEREKSKQP
jgi:hypothetical protein